jgi:hypothetical protein
LGTEFSPKTRVILLFYILAIAIVPDQQSPIACAVARHNASPTNFQYLWSNATWQIMENWFCPTSGGGLLEKLPSSTGLWVRKPGF